MHCFVKSTYFSAIFHSSSNIFIVMEDNVSLCDDAPVSSLLKRQRMAEDDALSDSLPVSFLVKRPRRTRSALSPKVP